MWTVSEKKATIKLRVSYTSASRVKWNMISCPSAVAKRLNPRFIGLYEYEYS